MKTFINPAHVIKAEVFPPNKNCGEPWDTSTTHGYQLRITLQGIPYDYVVVSDFEDEECALVFSEKTLGLKLI